MSSWKFFAITSLGTWASQSVSYMRHPLSISDLRKGRNSAGNTDQQCVIIVEIAVGEYLQRG